MDPWKHQIRGLLGREKYGREIFDRKAPSRTSNRKDGNRIRVGVKGIPKNKKKIIEVV